MKFKLMMVLTIAIMLLAACSSGDDSTPTPRTVAVPTEVLDSSESTEGAKSDDADMSGSASTIMLPAVDPLAVTGDIVTAGSSTVFPLSERMAERFQDEGYGGNITIDSIGSGAGFERFCVAGETDISNASRPIKDSEVESCQAISRDPIEFRVGTDALAVTVSAENDFATEVTMDQLAQLFSTAETWADVDPSWPKEPILRYIPGTDSGTFDYFVEEVFDKNEVPILGASNLELSEDDNVLVQGILGSPYAVGFFGYAYYQENEDTLNVLAIESVEPTRENVDSASYPLARPLYIYSAASIFDDRSQAADFINFYLTYVNEEIEDVGYFPANADDLDTSKQSWLDAISQSASAIMLPAVDPLAVTGDIVTAGSSTVFPLSERMAERFQDEGYGGNITIDSIGSGAGFERFCVAGETDISNSSRPIKDSEVESCQAIGREPIEFRVGTDALAVTVSSENDFVNDVTMDQLAQIFSTAETWADVDPSWPDEPILRYIPGTDSGTFDYFVEEVFDEDEKPILGTSNLELSEDDNVLVQGILGSPYAVGFFGYAYYAENQDTLNILSIDDVEATSENVDNASYPLARPLYIYSSAGIMDEKPQAADFINFYLTYVREEIEDVGYFPASDEAMDQSMQNWLDARG